MTAGQWLSAYMLGVLSGCGVVFLLFLLIAFRLLRRETAKLRERGQSIMRSATAPRPSGIPGA